MRRIDTGLARAPFALIAWQETFKKGLGYEQPRQYVITRGRRR